MSIVKKEGSIYEHPTGSITAQERFDSLIDIAYASGEPSPLTRADIDEARKVVKEGIAKRQATTAILNAEG